MPVDLSVNILPHLNPAAANKYARQSVAEYRYPMQTEARIPVFFA